MEQEGCPRGQHRHALRRETFRLSIGRFGLRGVTEQFIALRRHEDAICLRQAGVFDKSFEQPHRLGLPIRPDVEREQTAVAANVRRDRRPF